MKPLSQSQKTQSHGGVQVIGIIQGVTAVAFVASLIIEYTVDAISYYQFSKNKKPYNTEQQTNFLNTITTHHSLL